MPTSTNRPKRGTYKKKSASTGGLNRLSQELRRWDRNQHLVCRGLRHNSQRCVQESRRNDDDQYSWPRTDGGRLGRLRSRVLTGLQKFKLSHCRLFRRSEYRSIDLQRIFVCSVGDCLLEHDVAPLFDDVALEGQRFLWRETFLFVNLAIRKDVLLIGQADEPAVGERLGINVGVDANSLVFQNWNGSFGRSHSTKVKLQELSTLTGLARGCRTK